MFAHGTLRTFSWERELMLLFGASENIRIARAMSAFGGKADIIRLRPISANDPKRTLFLLDLGQGR